ncbi:hypothetical protein GJAV_G00058600, partial [Gymnothorax javanicus]
GGGTEVSRNSLAGVFLFVIRVFTRFLQNTCACRYSTTREEMAFANLGHAIPRLKLEETAGEGLFRSISMRSLQQLQQQLRSKPYSPLSLRRSISSQQSSQQSSHDDDSAHFLTPFTREGSTGSNSTRSSPSCSPVLRRRSGSPTLQSLEGEVMVEKSSEPPCEKPSPTSETGGPGGSRSSAVQSARSNAGKNSKKSQSWYNVLSPTYKQRNEDFRKLFKQLPDSERLIVDYSCALQRDILLQGRLYLSENWICFYSNIFRWETLLTVRLRDVCSMTKEKTARLIPNAVQICTDTEKHFFTSFGARDRTYMMMFRLWQNALLDKPLCPKELWHFVHQSYGNELGLTSDDEDYVPPDDDFNAMGEELPLEDNEVNDSSSKSNAEARLDASPPPPPPLSTLSSVCSSDAPISFDVPLEEFSNCLQEEEQLALPLVGEMTVEPSLSVPPPSLDFNDNEDLPTELSDSSETHDEGEVQAFHEDLNGRQYINEVYKLNVDNLYSILFTESPFMSNFMEQRRFSDVVYHPWKRAEEGHQRREIVYTIALSNPLMAKTTTVTEIQTLYNASQESECYIIDAEVIAHDVPYHDYFYTLNRYMLTRVAKNKCRLRVSTELRYRKQPWGLVRGFIEKNFWSGMDENFRHLEMELSKLAEVLLSESLRQSPNDKAAKTVTSRRRKRTLPRLRGQQQEEALSPVTTPTDDEVIHRIKHVAGEGSTQTRHTPDPPSQGSHSLYSMSRLLLIISLVLMLLVLLNAMLLYKLWMLEHSAQSLASWHSLRLHQSKLPQTQLEWAQLLEEQQRNHDSELQKWREIVKSSMLLLDQMKNSLLGLQKGVGLGNYGSEAEEKQSRGFHSLFFCVHSKLRFIDRCHLERGRNKERLEASLAGLCELELLRQRQECLVLGALSLGDTGPALGDLLPPLTVPAGLSRLPDDLTLRRQLNGLHSVPWGLMATLAQLMGELRADLEPQAIMGDSRPNSGLYELSEGRSPGGGTDPAPPVLRDPTPTCVREARGTSAGERPRSISDIFVAKWEGALDPRPAVPRSLSAPYEGGPWGPGLEVGPTVEDFREALRVEGYILGLLQRRTPRLPRTTSGPESRSLSRQSSLRRPNLQPEILTTSSSFPPGHPNSQPETLTPSPSFHLGYLNPHPEILTTSLTLPHQSSPHSAVRPSVLEPPCNSESNYSPDFLPNYSPESPQHTSTLLASPDQLVSAQYIPPSCQPPTSGKPSQTPCSPERSPPIGRSRAPPRKGRSSEVDSSAPRRTGRREGRSQSENSLLGQRRGCGDRKCSTVDRDGGRGLRDRHRGRHLREFWDIAAGAHLRN